MPILGVETERVVIQVDGSEVGKVQNRGKEVGQSFGNLVQQSSREDIC